MLPVEEWIGARVMVMQELGREMGAAAALGLVAGSEGVVDHHKASA